MLPLVVLALCSRVHQFPRGATYSTRFSIPFIGHQDVTLIVRGSSVATVSLDGVVHCDGDVVYTMQECGTVHFKIDEILTRFMQCHACTITEGRYDFTKDTAHITICLRPLALVRRLQLRRTHPVNTSRSIISSSRRISDRIVQPTLKRVQRFLGSGG